MASEANSSPERQPQLQPQPQLHSQPERSPQAQAPTPSTQAESAAAASPSREPIGLTLQSVTADGSWRQEYEGNSSWSALHRLAMLVNQDTSGAEPLAAISLTDRDKKFGARAERGDAGDFEIQFESTEGQALYKQVVRERQMELASPADNRISAEPLPSDRSARAAERGSRTTTNRTDALRRELVDFVTAKGTPELPAAGAQHERDRQVLERATTEQLKHLKQVSKTAQPEAFADALRVVQKQIARDVVRDVVRDPTRDPIHEPTRDPIRDPIRDDDTATRAAPGTPSLSASVNERFTIQERLGRREYWFRDRPDRLGFTENWLTLRTREHSAASIMGMVDRAAELGWRRLHLDGSPEFKREAWVTATARSLSTTGYTATLGDREAAEVERQRLQRAGRESGRGVQGHSRTNTSESHSTTANRVDAAGLRRPAEWTAAQELQLLRRAMVDAKVSPELEPRLLQLLKQRSVTRGPSVATPAVQLWDPVAPRTRIASAPADKKLVRSAQRER